MQKHVGMLTARTTEYETRHSRRPAGQRVDRGSRPVAGLKLKLENGAQAMTIPGIDLATLPQAKRTEALQKLNSQPCTCGCDLTAGEVPGRRSDAAASACRSRREIVKQIAGTP